MNIHISATRLLVVLALTLVGCSDASARGLDMGDMKTFASRVKGGGAECPLRFNRQIIRPAAVPSTGVVSPYRVDGSGSLGVIGADDPGSPLAKRQGIEISCWFQVDSTRVDVVVAGVTKGTAIGQLAGRLQSHAEATDGELATFLDVNAKLGAGQARVLTGKQPAAFARLASSNANVGLLLSMSKLDDKGVVPDADELQSIAARLAVALSS